MSHNSHNDDNNSDSLEVPSVTKLLNRKTLADFAKKTKKALPPEPKKSAPPQLSKPSEESKPKLPSPPTKAIDKTPEPQMKSEPLPIESNTITLASTITLETHLDSDLKIETNSSQKEINLSEGFTQDNSNSSFEIEHHGAPKTTLSPSSVSLKNDLKIEPKIEPKNELKSTLKIQSTSRSTKKQDAQKLLIWATSFLQTSADPLAHSILLFLQKGAQQALFLGLTQASSGSELPQFTSVSAVNPNQKLGIWTGLKWDPGIVPELWDSFVISGCVELPPPGTLTNIASNRNVVRSSFGLSKNEWLFIVRVGPANACRGVLVFVSNKSLLGEFEFIKTHLSKTVA